ncbi:MAG: GTPase HflX [Candidatus Aenigmatarchaeota archaeon]
MYETQKKEKALLIMVEVGKEKWPLEVLMEEFKNLVISTGIEVGDIILIKRKEISPALYIGRGKAEELAKKVEEKNIDVVIFNNNLSFTQQRNLEDILMVKTIDRTQLILDIFAHHAHTQEGILQVELAQLKYLLPRLKGKGIMLSRLGGGIGTRGPGEKKLEVDRRKITDRIKHLEKELNEVKNYRELLRKKREREKIPVCSLVGYTNAGKSTLFNALTQSQQKTSPNLFTTLDTVSRSFVLHNLKVILTDTVGFLYKIPPYLIEAFKATLEELKFADLLIHVIDANSLDIKRLIESVNTVLEDLSLINKPILIVFNKIDLINQEELHNLEKEYPEAIFVSALKNINLKSLKEKIYQLVFNEMREFILRVPFNAMDLVDYIHKHCEIFKKEYEKNEVVYWVRAKKETISYLEKKGLAVKEI